MTTCSTSQACSAVYSTAVLATCWHHIINLPVHYGQSQPVLYTVHWEGPNLTLVRKFKYKQSDVIGESQQQIVDSILLTTDIKH